MQSVSRPRLNKQHVLTKAIRSALLLSIPLGLYAPASLAATFTVNTLLDTEDATPGDGMAEDINGETSLRAAITEANALAGADDIVFDAALVANGDAEILLTLFDTGLDDGELGPTAFIVDSEVTITGPAGDNGITVERSGNNEFRFFHVTSTGNLTLENLTFVGGVAQGGHSGEGSSAGAGGAAGIGGAIVNEGVVNIITSTLTENQALGGSGGFAGSQFSGGAGGGGIGEQGGNGSDPNGGVGGGPNGGASNSASATGVGGGGAGGRFSGGAGSKTGGNGGAGAMFGGGGAGGMANATGGGATARGGNGGAGGFGGGGGGGGRARSGCCSETGGSGGAGGFAAGAGTTGGNENGTGGFGGGGAGFGGALFNFGGTTTIENSTLSGNVASGGSSGGAPSPYGGYNLPLGSGFAGDGLGGAIFNLSGSVTITSSTIAENTVEGGQSTNAARIGTGDGAIYNLGDGATATLVLTNTLVADTLGGDDVVGNTINGGGSNTSGVGNLIETQSGFAGGITTNLNPNLATLADNRGPTLTHALPIGSPAVDAGNNASVGSLLTDQRGGIFNRIADGDLNSSAIIDIGAFELTLIDYGDAPDFVAGDGPVNILFEQGSDDFRISFMGTDGSTSFRGDDPQVAYNATANEFFVVWQADDDTAPLVDNESEIFGQRINASTGALIGSRIRISTMGPDGDGNFDAFDAGIAWNSTTNQYLVVWEGDDDTAPLEDNENEIFGRLIGADGTPVAPQFRISTMGGPNGSTTLRANNPHVAYNATNNQFLVVWVGDTDTAPLVDNENEIFGRRVNADGTFPGAQFRISEMGTAGNANFDANDPRVEWNSTNNNYLVVWVSDDDSGSLVDNEQEVYNRVVGNDETLGTQRRVSFIGTDGDTTFGPQTFNQPPGLSYNPTANEFLITWASDKPPVNDEFEIYGQRVSGTDGALTGTEIAISDMGLPGNANFDATDVASTYNAATDSYLVVYRGDDDVDNKLDIYARRVSAAGVVLDTDDVRISHMGMGLEDANFDASTPAVAYNSSDERFLVAWEGDDDTAPLVDGETEIFGQLIGDLGIVDYSTRGSENGPAHRQANGLFMGSLIDDESDGQPTLEADGDDVLNTDDEDGLASSPVEFSAGTPMIDVTVTNTTGSAATLFGWIDYNGNGLFDVAERASIAVPNGSNGATVTLTFPAVPTSPMPATDTFARFRLSTDPLAGNPTGLVDDGEVEDYPAAFTIDITPDPFTFTDQTDVPLSTVQTSNTITVNDIDVPVEITVTGGEYSINGGGFTTVAGTVSDGDTVQVQHTSSANFGTVVDTTLDIGGVSDTFSSTTLAEDLVPDAFTFTDVTDVPLSTEQVSNTIMVMGINSPVAISVTGGEYSINGVGFPSAVGTVSDGDTVQVRHTSSGSFSTTVDTIVDIGGVSDTFSSTTLAEDLVPDAFTFTDVTDVPLSTEQVSNTITVSGINSPTAISVTGGEYSINGGGFPSAVGTVSAGDTVQVRHTSSASFSTAVDTIVDIGGVSDTFTSTTLAEDLVPDAFTFTDVTDVPLSTEQVSNTITVMGINSPAAISVTGGEYSINSGTFTAVAGTVSNGDTVQVRHTSSANLGTAVDTTLDIGGISDTFTSTTTVDDGDGIPASVEDLAPNNGDGNFDSIPDRTQGNVVSLPNAVNGDYITLAVGGGCDQIDNVNVAAEAAMGADPFYDYPLGLLGFELPCSSAQITVFYHSQNGLVGREYRKYGPFIPTSLFSLQFYTLPEVSFGASNGVTTATFSLSDGVLGDDNTATGATDGKIIDPGGPARSALEPLPAAPIPTLQPWGITLLGLFLAGALARFSRRRRA